MWPAIIAAGASLLGGAMNKSKSDSPQQQAQQAAQSSWSDINRVNQLNRQNALWTQAQNQASMDRALAQNRVNYNSPFGSTTWNRKPGTAAPTSTAPRIDTTGLTEAINALRAGSASRAGQARPVSPYSAYGNSMDPNTGLNRFGTFGDPEIQGGSAENQFRNRVLDITGGQQSSFDTSGIADALEALTGQLGDLGTMGAQGGAPADEWEMEQSLPPEVQAALDQMRGKYGENIGALQAGYTPRTAAEGALIEQLQGKYGSMVGDLESGFKVDNSVMQALKEQLQPGLDQARNRENARLAAMGLGTGSGSAWGISQDALNRSSNDANQKAVLGGFDAWNQSQANTRNNLASMRGLESGFYNDWLSGQNNIRGNLGTMAGLESTWRQNMQMPQGFAQASAAQMAQPTVAQPENRTWEAAQMANNQSAVNQAGNASMWNSIGNAAGSAWDNYMKPSTNSSPAYDPWGGATGGNYYSTGNWG